ncbi:MAG: hypothetical protein U0869_10760 [Chloroflexota bacterium]
MDPPALKGRMDAPILDIESITTDEDPVAADGVLRDRVLPELAARAGCLGAWAGRRTSGERASRVLAVAWRDVAAGDRARGDGSLRELVGHGRDHATLRGRIVLFERFPRHAPPRILRVYDGRTRPGELEAYVEEARAGVLLDGASPDGPVSVCMAVVAADRFVTVSTWTDWERLARCTGGDLDRPLVTRNAARLIGGGPVHLELIPPR